MLLPQLAPSWILSKAENLVPVPACKMEPQVVLLLSGTGLPTNLTTSIFEGLSLSSHWSDPHQNSNIDFRDVVQCHHPKCSHDQQSICGVPPPSICFPPPQLFLHQGSKCGVPPPNICFFCAVPPAPMYFCAFATLSSVLNFKRR